MTPFQCAFVKPHLAAFVDGELGGAEGLRVVDHLGSCASCAAEVAQLRAVGEALREATCVEADGVSVEGLVSNVLTRRRAEAATSWPGLLRRAQENHWLMIGGGAVAATLVSTVMLSLILAFGPRPARVDSLAALISNSEELAYAVPPGGESILMQMDDIGPWASRSAVEVAFRVSRSDRARTEVELVDALLAVVTDNGRPVAFEQMNARSREYAVSLLEDISRQRVNGRVPLRLSTGLRHVSLRASTTVMASASDVR